MALEELPHVARYGYGSSLSCIGSVTVSAANVTLEKDAQDGKDSGQEDAVRDK